MDEELFSYEDFLMIIDYSLKIKNENQALREIRSDVIGSALTEDRNLDEFEIRFLNLLEKRLFENDDKLKIFYRHIKAE